MASAGGQVLRRESPDHRQWVYSSWDSRCSGKDSSELENDEDNDHKKSFGLNEYEEHNNNDVVEIRDD